MASIESMYDATIGDAITGARGLAEQQQEGGVAMMAAAPPAAGSESGSSAERGGDDSDPHRLGAALRELVDAQLRVCEREVGTLTELNAAVLDKYRELEGPAKDIHDFMKDEPARHCSSLRSTLDEVDDVYESVQGLEQAVAMLVRKVEELERRAAT